MVRLGLVYKILFILLSLWCLESKPLTPQVIKYLEEDQITFTYYKENYRKLSCKIMTFSKMKYLYETKEIDKYMNQTQNQRGFLDYMQMTLENHCKDKYNDFNTVFKYFTKGNI
jgi:hypothetical protein